MRFSIIAFASAVVATAFAAPIKITKRDTASDINILNFALSLEHLESEFYKQGLAKYKRADFKHYGYDDKIWERIEHISRHEATHVTFLTSAIESLQGTPLPPCEYKFPLDSLESFLAVAQALEHTGTSAYLGAASGLEGELLTAAATITTVEARHASFLSELLGQSGIPYSFDTPLNAREVITIASNFVTSCPFDVSITPFTQLTATLPKKGDVKVETWFEGEKADTKYWCQFLYNDKIVVSPREECTLPATVVGYVYVVITDSSAPISLNDDSTIVAGPALLFNGSHDEY
ncbi:hypothetical protein BGZ92_008825 [Podila epicladia]|nr:hypothetical protein BGZ92_008825 [Podila epicladia]